MSLNMPKGVNPAKSPCESFCPSGSAPYIMPASIDSSFQML